MLDYGLCSQLDLAVRGCISVTGSPGSDGDRARGLAWVAGVDWGRYRLQVETTDPEGPATSYAFDGGWYVSATSTETPDALEIALDKDSYQPGEVARLKV